MKKTLLSLACAALFSVPALAQTNPIWLPQNFGAAVPASYVAFKMVTVNAATVWGLSLETRSSATSPPTYTRSYFRTIDGGTTWTGGAIPGLPANTQVSNISPLNGTTAWIAVAPTSATGVAGSGIYQTTNGGTTWTKQTTALFNQSASYANGVHFFDANNGVAWGDPVPAAPGGRFEIYTTTNGGTTWVRNNSNTVPTAVDGDEYGNAGSYYVLGNTIWLGGYHDKGLGARLFKSTDRGLTWSAAPTDLLEVISYIAFTDQQRGLMSSDLDLVATNDGGTTNTLIATTGNFRYFGLDAIPGLPNTYMSVGPASDPSTTLADRGSSISRDGGRTWTDLQTSIDLRSFDMASPSIGYAGAVTSATNTGGIFKFNSTVASSRANAAVQAAVQVLPNPSSDGMFTMNVADRSANPRSLSVTDALGREVFNKQLNATSGAVQNMPIDLSKHKAGLYTLKLDTEQGAVIKKLVVQ